MKRTDTLDQLVFDLFQYAFSRGWMILSIKTLHRESRGEKFLGEFLSWGAGSGYR